MPDSSNASDVHIYQAASNHKVSEYDQQIPQSHTAEQPTAPHGRATEHLQ